MSAAAWGRAAVTAQFALIALMLAWPAHWHVNVSVLAVAACSLALVAWVFLHNRPGNFNVRPEPRDGGHLITSGPYQLVRHPMYVALLLGMAAVAMAGHAVAEWLLWLALLAVLHGKASLEERLLVARWPDYAAYAARTGRFIPRPRRG